MKIYRGYSLGFSFFTIHATPPPKKSVCSRAESSLKLLTAGWRRGLWLALTLSFLAWTFAQTIVAAADKRLEIKVSYSTQQASVQDIVQQLAQQAGLNYDRQKSFAQTDPICRQWVHGVAIEGKTCREALDQILKPVGLRYDLVEGSIILARLASTAAAPATSAGTGGGAGDVKFEAARKALTGAQKDAAQAKSLLLEVVKKDKATLQADSLAYAYVYLGYIEDRAGNRTNAIAWYRQALAAPEGDAGIRECASAGLKQPLIWIRHLDEGAGLPKSGSTRPGGSSEKRPVGKGYVTSEQPPADLVPADNLTVQERRENFEFLCRAIDENYAGFELKSIDWSQIRRRYAAQVGAAGSADDFYRLLVRLVNELKDTHSWLQNYRISVPASGPAVTVDLFAGKPVVMAGAADSEAESLGAKVGSEIVEVDGVPVEKRLEALRSELRACSTERAFRREACRYLLAGEKGSTMKVKLRAPNGQEEVLAVQRTGNLRSAIAPACPFELNRQRFVHFGREPSGLGYIRVVSFEGREEIAREFDRALEALRSAPGLILDIRDNPGGYGQQQIVGRFLSKPTLCAISYQKNGPGHRDLRRHEDILEPTGPWQYNRPMALLVNDVTGSAADLFACYLRSANRVVTIGSTTHGNLSGVATFAVLPCGLVVRISNGYVCTATGTPIEGAGNVPDFTVAPTFADFLAGKDRVLERAVALLNEKPGRT